MRSACWNRITPACAGNSKKSSVDAMFNGDHPRLRGEQITRHHHFRTGEGSPPLARGTDGLATIVGARHRITPACAGNSRSRQSSYTRYRDHPRLRGEQPVRADEIAWRGGSPPLARGTVLHSGSFQSFAGITPACAGNRLQPLSAMNKVKDHPRLRGEQIFLALALWLVVGSPPLARGTEFSPFSFRYCSGITPACAGNSTLTLKK